LKTRERRGGLGVRRVLTTTDRSLVESLRVSLAAEGIEVVITNDAASGLPFIPVTVTVVDDADYERARALLHRLERRLRASAPWTARQRRAWRRAILAILALAVLAYVGKLVSWPVAVGRTDLTRRASRRAVLIGS